jgi:hypothetical protein
VQSLAQAIISSPETPFSDFLSATREWKQLSLTAELWNSRFPEAQEDFLAVQEACSGGVVRKLHFELDRTLEFHWNGKNIVSYRAFLVMFPSPYVLCFL